MRLVYFEDLKPGDRLRTRMTIRSMRPGYRRIKQAEIARFNLEVSDWEQREYFDLF